MRISLCHMDLKFDFWENGEIIDTTGPGGPGGEVYMDPMELAIYLHRHAVWSA